MIASDLFNDETLSIAVAQEPGWCLTKHASFRSAGIPLSGHATSGCIDHGQRILKQSICILLLKQVKGSS
jgi:hypothetical protein